MDIILVANDHPNHLILLTNNLLAMNFQVATASMQRDAMEIARLLKPRLIFLDLLLKEGNGWEACQQLKADAELCHIPVVVVSAAAEKHQVEQALAVGCDEFIPKPYTRDQIKAAVERWWHKQAP